MTAVVLYQLALAEAEQSLSLRVACTCRKQSTTMFPRSLCNAGARSSPLSFSLVGHHVVEGFELVAAQELRVPSP